MTIRAPTWRYTEAPGRCEAPEGNSGVHEGRCADGSALFNAPHALSYGTGGRREAAASTVEEGPGLHASRVAPLFPI
jgi:hypothetical protein